MKHIELVKKDSGEYPSKSGKSGVSVGYLPIPEFFGYQCMVGVKV